MFWAFAFEQGGEFGGRRLRADFAGIDLDLPGDMKGAPRALTNTTIAIVATDAALTRVELKRIAIMASDGFARALRPVHTPFDGDTVFAMSTSKRPIGEPRQRDVLRLGSIAADCLARAIARCVYEAQSLGQTKSYKDTFKGRSEMDKDFTASPITRRAFAATGLVAGFTLATGPLNAATIMTDANGLDAGEVSVTVADGKIPAYRAKPAGKSGLATILVVQEVFGVHEHIKDICRRFAHQGYYAIAPSLYARYGDPGKYDMEGTSRPDHRHRLQSAGP